MEKKIKITNLSHCDVFIDSPNLSQFRTSPQQFRLAKDEEKELTITFKPKNLGKVDLKSEFLVNKQYSLLFRLEGLGISPTQAFKQIMSEQNSASKNAGSLISVSMVQLGRFKQSIQEPSKVSLDNELPSVSLNNLNAKLPKIVSQSATKIDYLKESRITRLKADREKKLKTQMNEVEEKIKETINQLQEETPSDKRNQKLKKDKILPPISKDLIENDIKFLFNPNHDGLDSPRLEYPPEEKFLYVTKPIGNYEPADVLMNKQFDPDPNTKVKPLPSKPTHHFVRDINLNLDGEMLKKIQAGPKIIQLGDMFIKSTVEKTFFLRNDMKDAISARLILDEECIMLSYEKPQILLSGQLAGFRVSFRGLSLG